MALFDLVIEIIQADDWSFHVLEPDAIITLEIALDSGQFQGYFLIDEETDCVQFHLVLPITVPATQLQTASEFICRVNYGLLIGHFDIDLDDGEVRYRTSIILHDAPTNANTIRNVMYPTLMMVDHYFPAFMKVIYGDTKPIDAIAILDDEFDDEFDEEFDEEFDDENHKSDHYQHFDPRDLN